MAAALVVSRVSPAKRVDVERDDGEDVAAADRESAAPLQRARRDRPWLGRR